jgi:hypothetical protein
MREYEKERERDLERLAEAVKKAEEERGNA